MSVLRAMRRRFEVVPGQHRPRTVRNGAIAVALLAFLLTAGYSRSIPFWPAGGDIVRAEFADAGNVRAGQEVRVRGVKVGTVDAVERREDSATAVVTMRLTEDDRPALREDARATVYWRTLLGRNMYIELDPGTMPGRLADAVIPASRTDSQVELDMALTPLDEDGRRGLTVMLDELREGLAETGAAVRALEQGGPALDAVAGGLPALRGRRPGDLSDVVDGLAGSTRALDRAGDRLAGLIDGGALTLAVTATRRADLAATVRAAPATLARTRAELEAISGTLERLDPLVADMRPGARALDDAVGEVTPALRIATPLLRDAEPLLEDLQPAVRRLRSAGRAGTPLVETLGPTVDRLREDIVPWLTGRDQHTGRRIYETVGPTFASLGALTQAFDAHGHDVPFQGGSGVRALGEIAPCEVLLSDPTAAERVRCDALTKGLEALFAGGSR